MVNVDFNNEKIFLNGQEIGEIFLTDRDKFLVLDKINIYPEYRNNGFAQQAMEQIIEYSEKQKKILALTPSNDFGSNKNKLINWYKSLGFIMNKGRNKDFRTMQLMFRKPSTMNEMIRREIWSMDEDLVQTQQAFDLKELDKLPSFAARKRYADENLNKIGAGSARIVYEMPDNKVLKLAKNAKGIAQNEYECQLGNDYYANTFTTEVYDCDPTDMWILSERAKKLTPTRFFQLTGVKIDDVSQYLNYQYFANKGRSYYKPQNFEELNENEFLQGIYSLMMSYDMPAGDLGRLSSYGEVMRDGEPDVVLIDSGLSDDVYQTHYSGIREAFASYFGDEEEINEITLQMNNFLDNAAEDADIKDGGYAGNAIMPQTVSEDFMNFKNVGFDVLKKAIEYIKNFDLGQMKDMVSKVELNDLHNNYMITTQNIDDVLKITDNDIETFNDIINVQNFLKNHKVINEDLVYWHADDATEDEYKLGAEGMNEEIVNEDIEEIKKETGNKIANYVAKQMNLGTPRFIGEGQNGYAYEAGSVIIKITKDKSEAIDSLEIKGQRNERIADIYEVFHTNEKRAKGFGDIYVIVLEKLKTSNEIEDTYDTLDVLLAQEYGRGISWVVVHEYLYNRGVWDNELGEDVMTILNDHPNEKQLLLDLIAIADEVKRKGIDSVDYVNPENLGLKKSGKLGFFDVGSDDSLDGFNKQPTNKLQTLNVEGVNEDGTSLYTNAQGTVDSGDISWDLQEMVLDSLSNLITERIKSWMPKAKEISVKKKCQLGGNGDGTSTACNQGDIDNIEMKDIQDENTGKPNEPNVAEDNSDDRYFKKDINHIIKEALTNMNPIKKNSLNEEKVKFGALMLYFDIPAWDKFISVVKEEDLYDDGSGTFGKEHDPHITVLYGFHDGVKAKDFDKFVSDYKKTPLKAEKISLFNTNPDFDVVKIDIEPTEELLELREKVETLPNTLTYKDYHPHMTIAYVKKGKGRDYIKNFDEPIELVPDRLVFSNSNREKTDFKLKENNMLTESSNFDSDYRKWKRENVTYRGVSDDAIDGDNNGMAMLGQGLYSVPASNKAMAKKYGNLVILVNAIPKKPKIVNTLNEWEIWFQQNVVFPISKSKGKDYPDGRDVNSISDEMIKLGYDGVIIKGREIVNYKPENVRYYYNERQLEMHYDNYVTQEENMIKEANIMSLNELPFKQEIEKLGGKIYSVGGAVRDEFLGKDSKDLDILITGISMENLESLLQKYGKVDAVGKSFGVIKFVPQGSTDDIDIAIPRTEKKTGDGHQGFDVTSDHNLPIEDDLRRRDFTINAIAKDSEGNLIDPFGGQKDLQNKLIRVVNPEAFADDPLRMLRATQFASRFGFTIEPKTMDMIQANASKINEIAGERIFIELEKIVNKGNKRVGAQLLKDTGLFQNIFGFDLKQSTIDRTPFEQARTMGEFIFLLTRMLPNPSEVFRTKLKGDVPTTKEIEALNYGFNNDINNGINGSKDVATNNRIVVHNMFNKSPNSIDSAILPEGIKNAANELKSGKYPKSFKELAVNGNDLMALGLKGKEIGEKLKSLLINVYSDKVRNNKKELLDFLANGGS